MSSVEPGNEFSIIRDTCKERFRDKELWPTYFDRRYLEFMSFYEFLPQKRFVRILELGCGVGYYSAFLSKIADEVVATDLEVIDPNTHSPGLQITRDFLEGLGIRNVVVKHASAEELPFEDDSFDLVFSSHVIEHVPDTDKAVSEIARVLKPGGYNFCVVPTSTDRIHAFYNFYIFLFQRAMARIFRRRANNVQTEGPGEVPAKDPSGGIGAYFRHFPFPPPHGVHPHYFTELRKWTLGNWRKILCKDPRVEFIEQHSLQMNIFFPGIAGLHPRSGVRLFAFSRSSENKLSTRSFFRHFGISTLIITRRKG